MRRNYKTLRSSYYSLLRDCVDFFQVKLKRIFSIVFCDGSKGGIAYKQSWNLQRPPKTGMNSSRAGSL